MQDKHSQRWKLQLSNPEIMQLDWAHGTASTRAAADSINPSNQLKLQPSILGEAKEPIQDICATRTMPTSTSCWNWRAAAPERVKMAVPFPCSLPFTIVIASSRLDACRT